MSEHDKPVGMFSKFSSGVWHEVMPGSGGAIPLYTRPAQWVGLTDEEIDKIYAMHHDQYGHCISTDSEYERAIEAALKEKNT